MLKRKNFDTILYHIDKYLELYPNDESIITLKNDIINNTKQQGRHKMNRKQFKAAWITANDPNRIKIPYQDTIDIFNGFGLDGFNPINCTINQVACLINYQCKYFNGGYDMEALEEIEYFGRRNFKILDI